MFNIFKLLKEVEIRRQDRAGKMSFHAWYMDKLNNQDIAVTREVQRKIKENRKRADENSDYLETPVCICVIRGK